MTAATSAIANFNPSQALIEREKKKLWQKWVK